MKRKITAAMLLALLIFLLGTQVFAAVDEPWQNDWDMLRNEEIHALKDMQTYMLDQTSLIYSSYDPGGLGINMRFRISDSSEGDIEEYANDALKAMLEADKTAKNVMVIAYYEDTDETAVAVDDNFSLDFSKTELKKLTAPLGESETIMSLRLMQVINNLASLALEKGDYDETVFEPGVNGEAFLGNYNEYIKTAVSEGDYSVVTVAVIAVALLAVAAVLYALLRKTVAAVKVVTPILAVIILCGAGYFGYKAMNSVDNYPETISAEKVETVAVSVGSERLAGLNISGYEDGNQLMSPVSRMDGILTEWWQFGNQCYYSKYASAEMAEQEFTFFEKFKSIYTDSELRKIEGENFKLLICEDPLGYVVYYLQIDDEFYYCIPTPSEISTLMELFEEMGLSPEYVKDFKA